MQSVADKIVLHFGGGGSVLAARETFAEAAQGDTTHRS